MASMQGAPKRKGVVRETPRVSFEYRGPHDAARLYDHEFFQAFFLSLSKERQEAFLEVCAWAEDGGP